MVAGCYIDCLNTEFTYGGKSWRIELWKGRYGISLGCEIGVYYKRGSLFSNLFPGFYDCSDINYPMFSVLFLISGANKNPKEEIISFAQTEHWWLTQFVFNITTPVVLSTNNRLAMIGAIDLRDTQFAIAYNRNLQQQHAGEIESTLFYYDKSFWVVILWGDVQNIIYNHYYQNYL